MTQIFREKFCSISVDFCLFAGFVLWYKRIKECPAIKDTVLLGKEKK